MLHKKSKMGNKYDKIKIRPAKFDDTKYATRSLRKEQKPFKLRDFLKSIPIIGGFLAKIFISEEKAYKVPQLQISSFNEVKDENHIGGNFMEVSSKLEKSNVERVDNEKKDRGI